VEWNHNLTMVQNLQDLLDKNISVLIAMGPKGPIKIKGIVRETNDDSGMITLEVSAGGGGMLGGAKKTKEMIFFVYGILGLEIEEVKQQT